MIKVKLTGKVIEVSGINTVGEKNTQKQTVIFKEDDSAEDEFTGRTIPGGYWMFDIIGDDVKRLDLNDTMEQKKALASLIIRSDAVGKKDNPNDLIYPVNVNLVRLQLLKDNGEPF